MAIYGIGAFYDGTTDVSPDFISQGVACLGWAATDAPALHRLLAHVKTGDILYIKAHPPGRELTVKAVGIVVDETVRQYSPGFGVQVRWLWRGSHVFREGTDEKYNVRSNTLYEEVSPIMQNGILELLFSVFTPPS